MVLVENYGKNACEWTESRKTVKANSNKQKKGKGTKEKTDNNQKKKKKGTKSQALNVPRHEMNLFHLAHVHHRQIHTENST